LPKIETLVEDIYGLFEAGAGAGDENDRLSELALFRGFGDNLHDLMEARFHNKREGGSYLRMSNIGRPDRQLWFDINGKGERENFLPATLIKFAYGDMIEQMMLLYAKMAGHEVTHEQAEVEVDGIKGHIDAIIDGCLVDVKSASSFSFQKFDSGALFEEGNDPFGYVAQLCGYIEATGCERGGFLAVDKTLGKVCFCEIPKELIEKYNVKQRIEHIKEVINGPDLPPRCYPDVPDGKSGNFKLGTGCSYCPHKFNCWSDSNGGEGLKTYYYSTGPRYLTKVVREPKVQAEFPDRADF
jgi:hypothetical protein